MQPFVDLCQDTIYTVTSVPGDGGCAVSAAAAAVCIVRPSDPVTATTLYKTCRAKVDPALPADFDAYKQNWTTVPVRDASADTWFEAMVPDLTPSAITVPFNSPPPPTICASKLLPHYPGRPRIVFINAHGHYWCASRR